MKWPKISIVTCSFNQVDFLEETMLSVLKQEYPNLEYIIIDGGSTDGSVEIIKKYADQLTYWVSEPDKGQTHALRKGFGKSTGEIQGWLCSDDILEVGALKEIARFFLDNPQADVVYGDCSYIDKAGRLIRVKRLPGFHKWLWLWDGYIPQPSTFWLRNVYERVGGLDPSFEVAMDKDLWQKFSEITKIHHFPRLWSRMRIYREAKTHNMAERGADEEKQIISSAVGRPIRRARNCLPYYAARAIRLACEGCLSVARSLDRKEVKGRPLDSLFFGIGPAYKRFGFISFKTLKV